MIKSFKHKGLKLYFETAKTNGISADHAKRLRLILARLHAATSVHDIALPGLRLHQLKGQMKGYWAVDVSGNWRVTFRFEGVHALDVNYLDYH